MTNAKNVIEDLKLKMIEYFKGDPKRIHHLLKVHSFAKLIGTMEKINDRDMLVLESAALVHDIGIRPALEKYGDCSGKLQEQEGGEPAEKMLASLGFDDETKRRVRYLVEHHHTYNNIDGADYQILVESDFLVNLYEDGSSAEAAERAANRIFKTKYGSKLLKECFLL